MQCAIGQWVCNMSGDDAYAVCDGSMGMQNVRG